ncbi:ELM2 domain-containing protein [Euphorbia peplus]|nr:ELM2 domain-containing protein [Euphorbia peplus]
MIHKRPFDDEASNEVSCKHARHVKQIDHLGLSVPLDDHCRMPLDSDYEYSLGELQGIDRSANDQIVLNEFKRFETGACSSFPPFFWISNGIHEADNLSFFPEYFDHAHQPRVLLQSDDVFSSIDCPLQKPVSIGPEHQAFVPEWEDTPSGLHITVDAGYEERLMGTCVIPMPESGTLATHCSEGTETGCSCLDQGSTECVKQHVVEAREKLRKNLGEEAFEGLGFNDMGETVARKWTEMEEQIFHNVVLSNPVSIGRNFWEHLSVAFPSRKRSELVSYYFNVFMLRIRSEQNRFDPLSIDSDNDEWQRSDSPMGEEEDDYTMESPNEQDTPAYYKEDLAEDCNEQTEDEDETGDTKESADYSVRRTETDEEYEGDIDDISMVHGGSISRIDYGGNKHFKNSENDIDVEDGSCTSYEYQQDNADCGGPLDTVSGGRHSNQE